MQSPTGSQGLTAATKPTSNVTTAPKPATAKPATKSKARKRVNTAEKRSQHNAIERQRRETLNSKFIDLARLLPSLVAHRRPTKFAIVNGSIGHLNYQRGQRLLASKLLRQMCAERDALLKEVNDWRKAGGFAPREHGSAWTDEVEEVLGVEKEVFGTFSHYDDGEPADDDTEMVGEVPSIAVPETVHGPYTPRPSTAMHASAAMFGNMSVPDVRPSTAPSGSWSTEFAYGMGSMQPPMTQMSFMSDSLERPLSSSPSTSQQGNLVTPPTTANNAMIYDHTPSPKFSLSLEHDPKVSNQNAPSWNWNAAQTMYLQQQAQVRRQQERSNSSVWGQSPFMFGSTQSLPLSSPSLPQPHVQHAPTSDFESADLTQQLLASVLGASSASPDQVQEWRKATMCHVIPQDRPVIPSHMQPELAMPRNNMGLKLSVVGLWPENQTSPVAGF